MLGATVRKLVATASGRPGFVHHCSKCKTRLVMLSVREPVWEIISQHCALVQNTVSQPTLSVEQSCARTVRQNCHGAAVRGTKAPLSQPLHHGSVDGRYHSTVGVITKGSCMGAQITGHQICTVARNTCGFSLWTSVVSPFCTSVYGTWYRSPWYVKVYK
jgi:hypothetical protein